MQLVAKDESPHEAPERQALTWQENYFFVAWDASTRAGFLVHLMRVPHEGHRELIVAAAIGEEVASFTRMEPDDGTLAGPGWSLTPSEPFKRWRLRVASTGHGERGTGGMVAHRADGSSSLALDVELESIVGPVDYAGALGEFGMGGATDRHYEAGGSWNGSVAVGHQRVAGDGLFVRDHTWGIRDHDRLPPEHQWPESWWTPTVVPERNLFVNAILVHRPSGWTGVGVVADAEGTRFTQEMEVTGHPSAGLCGYSEVTVRLQDPAGPAIEYRSQVGLHLPIRFEGGGHGRYANEALTDVVVDGHQGFAVAEYSNFLSSEQIRSLTGDET